MIVIQMVSENEHGQLTIDLINSIEAFLKSKGWRLKHGSEVDDGATLYQSFSLQKLPSFTELRETFAKHGRGGIPPEMLELDPETFEYLESDLTKESEMPPFRSPASIKMEIDEVLKTKEWLTSIPEDEVVLTTFGAAWKAGEVLDRLEAGDDEAMLMLKALMLSQQQEREALKREAEEAAAEALAASEVGPPLSWDDEDQYLAGGSPISDQEIAGLLNKSRIWAGRLWCSGCDSHNGTLKLAQGPTIRPVSQWAVQLECQDCGLLTTYTKSILARWLNGKAPTPPSQVDCGT